MEAIRRYIESNEKDERSLLRELSVSGPFKMKEALDICRIELGNRFNEERFREAALEVKVESLPNGGTITDDGVTVVKGEWDD